MEKRKILIVDDDANIAELIALYLTKECFKCEIAEDGERCREQALASDSCVLRNDLGYSFLLQYIYG